MSPEDDFQTESTQEVITQEEQKVNFRRFAVIGLIIFLAAFYFVWKNFLNFGTLEIYGDIPYDVLVFDDQNYTCDTQPCELKMDRGEKSLSFFKFGFEAESQSVEVPLWSTVSTRVKFEIKPYMEEITVINEEPQNPSTKTDKPVLRSTLRSLIDLGFTSATARLMDSPPRINMK